MMKCRENLRSDSTKDGEYNVSHSSFYNEYTNTVQQNAPISKISISKIKIRFANLWTDQITGSSRLKIYLMSGLGQVS